ncbi:GGDEF domain-containing protein [Terrilactibacillus sp. S3-3]|nr:GGDEF domain-containing protein [Terrilactibacillus sp. S3-3]
MSDSEQAELTVEAIGKVTVLEQQIVLEAYQDEFFAEEERQKEIMRYKAYHDELTGLPNRRMAGQALASAIETCQAEKMTFSVMELNIDHFKMINDSLGHVYGDEFLRMVSRRMISALKCPSKAAIARMGSDEFNMICCGLNRKETAALAKQMIYAVREPYRLKDSFYVMSRRALALPSTRITAPIRVSY